MLNVALFFSKLWVTNVLIDGENEGVGVIVQDFDPKEAFARVNGQRLHEAFLEHHVLCLRGGSLSHENFLRLSRYFGEPKIQLTIEQESNAPRRT